MKASFLRSCSLSLLVAASASGKFVLVEDFSDGATGAPPLPWVLTNDSANETRLILAADPDNAAERVGELSGAPTTQGKTGNAYLSLPQPVAYASTAATLFGRFRLEGESFFHAFIGLAKDPNPGSWSDYSAYFGLFGTGVDLLARNGPEGSGSNTDVGNLQVGVWYYFWLVLNNVGDTWSLYINATGQTPTIGDQIVNGFEVRDTGDAPVTSILLRMGLQKDASARLLIDDLFIDNASENLINPLASFFDYEAYIEYFFPGVTDPDIVGLEADADGDGVRNCMEFKRGSHPGNASSFPKLNVYQEGDAIVVTFRRLRDAPLSDYRLEWSPSLGEVDWTALGVTPILTDDVGPLPEHYETVEVFVPLSE